MNDYKKALKTHFGFDEFRDKQLEIIKYILEDKRDCSVVMATGSGKSLPFQFCSVYSKKTVLVISPLISLMNDQLMKLKNLNISACSLNSTVDNKIKLKKEILENKYRLVYVTPEYITKQHTFIQELVEKDVLCLFSVDESHALSTWGMDFREAYRKLNCLKELAPTIPILALTATATLRVQKDIISHLGLDKPAIIRTSFDRPNLVIKVKPKGPDPMKDLLPLIKENERCIIYCQTRDKTDEIAELLKKNDISCLSYHAGMNSDDREDVHNKFANNEIAVICATIAFGMGIDITIRRVIHYGIPKNMESYYQEIGRAGRDGIESYCFLLYSLPDMTTNNYFINQISNVAYRNNQMQLALVMKNYIFSSQCRRKYILEYFGEEYKPDNCGNCDNCLNKKDIVMHDFAKEAALLFQVSNLTNNVYGGGMLINILRGSGSKKIPAQYAKNKLFGTGKDHTDKWWKMLLMFLVNDGYFKEKPISGGHAFTLSLTSKASTWLNSYKQDNTTTLKLAIPDDMNTLAKPVKKTPVKKAAVKKAVKKGIIVLDE